MYDKNKNSHIKVALLSGGSSGEREISLKSGKGARSALEEAGYDVIPLDPANKDDLRRMLDEDLDVAFLCMHGRGGEDGCLQGFLETIGLPYTGSNVAASAISMDKAISKLFYEKASVPTPPSVYLKEKDSLDIDSIIEELGEECVVKASHEGSSIGVYITKGKDDLEDAIDKAFAIDDTVVIERYISGREFTVVVLGADKDTKVLPVLEIIPKNETYDFESKYSKGGSEHVCPADIDNNIADSMKALALRAHDALGCYGVSRTDFILDENDSLWALETNTLPGMTEVSLLPDSGRAAGISFPEICSILVESAIERSKPRK